MSIRVMQWVWEHSPTTRGDRLVLLAIADCASDDGTRAWPSLPTIAEKANLTVRACQSALRRLTKAGHLEVEMQTGPRGVNRYTVVMTKAVSKLRGEERTPGEVTDSRGEVNAPEGVKLTTESMSLTSPVTVLEPSIEPSDEPSNARAFNDRVNDLAKRWSAMVPLSNLNQSKSVLAKALGTGATFEQVNAAMESLVGHYGLTEHTLRIALQELAPKRSQSTTNGRVQRGLELAAMYDQQDNQAAIEGAR